MKIPKTNGGRNLKIALKPTIFGFNFGRTFRGCISCGDFASVCLKRVSRMVVSKDHVYSHWVGMMMQFDLSILHKCLARFWSQVVNVKQPNVWIIYHEYMWKIGFDKYAYLVEKFVMWLQLTVVIPRLKPVASSSILVPNWAGPRWMRTSGHLKWRPHRVDRGQLWDPYFFRGPTCGLSKGLSRECFFCCLLVSKMHDGQTILGVFLLAFCDLHRVCFMRFFAF